MQETWVRSLGREDPLEKEMVTQSSILAWRIPWTEEPGRLQSMGSQRVRQDWATSLSLSLSRFVSYPWGSCCGSEELDSDVKEDNAPPYMLWYLHLGRDARGGILEKRILELAFKAWLGVFQAGRAGLCVLGEESHGKDTKEWKDTSAIEKPNPKDF